MNVPLFAELTALPERPPSEVEWEDLLVRMELFPRAVRGTIELADEGTARGHDRLSRLAARELWICDAIERLRTQQPIPSPFAAAGLHGGLADRGVLLRSLGDLRARSFAAVQRRGVEVWDWAAEHEALGRRITAYQFIGRIVHADGREIAALRAALHGEPNSC